MYEIEKQVAPCRSIWSPSRARLKTLKPRCRRRRSPPSTPSEPTGAPARTWTPRGRGPPGRIPPRTHRTCPPSPGARARRARRAW
eukprot:5897988-Pyramimonas_sp.AAC.1